VISTREIKIARKLETTAARFAVLLGIAQLLAIDSAAYIILLPQPAILDSPWFAPLVKIGLAIIIVLASAAIFWKAVLALSREPEFTERRGALTLVNVLTSVISTGSAGIICFIGFIFSLGDAELHPSEWWMPLIGGGMVLLVFAIVCWSCWLSIVFSQRCLRQGRKQRAFGIALSPTAVISSVFLILSLTHG
jgi:hypothetical protein